MTGCSAESCSGIADQAKLVFSNDTAGDSVLCEQYAAYPFHLCRPLHVVNDPPGMVTLYLQSVSGGIFEDDRLGISITMESGAHAHVTTQASAIVHSMESGHAHQHVLINAGADTLLEYLPDPAIFFPQARFASKLRIRVHETASVITGESFLVHDPLDCGSPFAWLHHEMRIETPDGRLLAMDRFQLSGERWAEALPGVSGAPRVQATFVVISRTRDSTVLAQALREGLDHVPDIYAGASVLPGDCGAWARMLAPDGATLRTAMGAAWGSVRELLTGKRPTARQK